VGHIARPVDYPPAAYLPDPRSGRFDDPLKEYRTLYCARHQSVALRESLQQFRHSTETLSKLKSVYGAVYGAVGVPPAKVPDDWRAAHVLAPARIRLAPGSELVGYEEPGLLRTLEEGFAEFLDSQKITSLDIPALRSKDRIVSQLFGRFLYSQGYAGIVFESGIPPGGASVALFEGRAWLEATGPARPLSASLSTLRTVCGEFGLALS
jgi:hypothetical protein